MKHEKQQKSEYWDRRMQRAAPLAADLNSFVAELNKSLALKRGDESGARFEIDRSVGALQGVAWRGRPESQRLIRSVYQETLRGTSNAFPLQLEPLSPSADTASDDLEK